jgi:hypothetical protein
VWECAADDAPSPVRVGEPGVRGGQVLLVDRAALEDRYRSLVREELPAAARAGGWVLVNDHCFGRVLLDDAVGGCWYDHLDRRRTAFRQLSDDQLVGAVALGERLLVEGDPLLRELDARSLAWRGKPQKPAPRRTAR